MMFTWGTHTIDMAPVLHFDKNPRGKKSTFLVMTHGEKKLDEAVKETNFFYQVVSKRLMSVAKEKTTISEVLGILENFKELTIDELPNNFPPMRDKHQKIKSFNMGDGVMVFPRKERFPVGTYSKLRPHKYGPFTMTQNIDYAYMVALLDFLNISNTFNVVDIHEYQTIEALYREESLGSSSLQMEKTDVGRFFKTSKFVSGSKTTF